MPTPVTLANFSVDAGWGAGAVATVVGTQQRCQLTINSGTAPTISPTFTFTYPDGAYPLEPGILARMVAGTGQFADLTYQPGTTSTQFTFMDLPEASKSYVFNIDTAGI